MYLISLILCDIKCALLYPLVAPPAGVLDARIEVDGLAMNGAPVASQPTDYRLTIQGSDLELSWDIAAGDGQAWQLVIDGQAHDLIGTGSFTFVEALSQPLLRYGLATTGAYAGWCC